MISNLQLFVVTISALILLSTWIAQSIIKKSRSKESSDKPKSTIVHSRVACEEPGIFVALKDESIQRLHCEENCETHPPVVIPSARVKNLVCKILRSRP